MSVWDPSRVLLPSESGLEDRFLALCKECEVSLAAGDDPTPATRLLAYSMASDLWRFWRATGDSAELEATVTAMEARSRTAARLSAQKSAEDRVRTRQIHAEGVNQSIDLHDLVRGRSGKRSRKPRGQKLRLLAGGE